MHSVHAGMWDPQPPSKHVSPLPPPSLSNHRPTHVTTVTPAKRITFFKSGDNKFGGVKMAIHRRSFKCFDALLDDLTQKVPLPFGVRTVTTPRGIHTIKELEQLQDGGCYLCSDRRYAKPVNLELASRRPNMWHHHGRRPHRPEVSSTTPPGHPSHRQRRILLIKNTEPGMRRSVVLNRRSTRSLKAFLDEVSEVMQFHVRKLYTAEGRRIDSVQSLITCSGVLVCVGREAFSPMLVNFIRKSSDEKLPGLGSRSPGLGPRTPGNGARSPATQGARSPPHGAQSRASEYSEGHESKKNVNFGLETKKSIIHPRSDSSNRSTRFSLSSEKSYGNGVSTYSRSKPAIINDDIEKRVLVNKDGSLSVEMKVRFRLHNDETVQWSTQIKKSPSLTNECCPMSQAQPHYLQQGQSESCSDPDSNSFDPDGVEYTNQPMQHVLDGSHCPCCYQRQEQQYDLWENPAHIHKQVPVPPPHASSHTHTMMRHTHSSSSSSSCNSRRVVRCRARLSNSGGGSGSEQSQVVQEEMCVTEQVERRVEVEQDGDTHVEVCRVSRCCSRSEVVSLDGSRRPLSRKSVEDGLMEEEERPLSGVSSSSHVLQSLKEDQDDEDDDLPPSVSQCSHSHVESPNPSSQIHLSDKPASAVTNCSIHSKHKDSQSASAACSCHCGSATPHSTAGAEELDRASSSRSKTSTKSTHVRIENSHNEETADDGEEGTNRVASGLSAGSQQSESLCSNCRCCKRNSASNSRASQRSNQNPASSLSNEENANAGNDDDDGSDVSAVSTQSNKSNLTNCGRLSGISNGLNGRASKSSNPQVTGKEEERALSAASATSHHSSRSHKSACNSSMAAKEEKRSPSSISAHSNMSARSSKSQKSNCSGKAEDPDITAREEAEGENEVKRSESSLSAKLGASAESHESPQENDALEENDTNERAQSSLSGKSNASAKSEKEERPQSVLSAKSGKSNKSNVTAKSGSSRKSTCSHCATEGVKAANEAAVDASAKEEETEERAVSAMSAKSILSAKSNKSCKSGKASERSVSPRSLAEDREERPASQRSVRSVKSNASVKSNCNGTESVQAEEGKKLEEEEEQRPQTAASAKSENSDRPDSALSAESKKSCCNDKSGEELDTGDCEEDAKSAASAKSHRSNCGTVASSGKDKRDGNRTPSAMSGKSNTSSNKSPKSKRSNRTAQSPNIDDAEVADANEEQESVNEGRAESVKSAKSRSSVRSSASQKSKNLKSASPNQNVITIKTPDGLDEEGNEEPERASSTVSAKSGKSNKTDERADDVNARSPHSEGSHGQMLSPKRTQSPQIPKTPAPSPCSPQSPAKQLLPDPGVEESRGPSALSVRSTTSAKSGKPKCHCGSSSPRDKLKIKDEEVEKNVEEPVEKAESILSSSPKRNRKASGGTEQPPSPNSFGSVSLGLPEDQETGSDSGKSTASFHRDGERKGKAKSRSPDAKSTVSSKKGDTERAESKINLSECSNNTPAIEIPTIETPGGGEEKGYVEQGKERAPSAFSSKTSKSQKSACKCKIKAAADHELGEQSLSKAEHVLETASVKSAASNKDAPDKSSSSALSSVSAKSASKAKVKEDKDAGSLHSKSPCCLRPESAASAHSQKTASKQGKEEMAIKGGDNGSIKSVKTSKSSKKENSRPCPVHSSKPRSKAETCSESTLSHSLSAADLLKETMAATRPQSRQSKASKASDKPQSEKSGKCQKGRNHDEEMTPACLPNASPNEVVSDWLRSIPVNSNMLELGDELNEEPEKEKDEQATKQEEESPETEGAEKMEEVETEKKDEDEEIADGEAADKEKTTEPVPDAAVRTSSHPSNLTSEDSLPKSWHSSTAVMKVLLGSSLGRCRSMPEVSPVYGRRLSTSARGLLDCLAQLQLIEPAANPGYEPQKSPNGRYEDIMAILQSLWLAEPRGLEGSKDVQADRVTPPRSSSGVGMSSGSGGSGKENETQREVETPPKEEEELHEDEGGDKGEEESRDAVVEDGGLEALAASESEANVAEDTTPTEDPSEELENQESPKDTENPSSSDKSSANDSSKSHTDNERETPEDSSSSTPPTVLRAPLSKRLSQDPDPVWVLHLLKKLEKQFMNHYINAMAEFKVRWDLDDSLVLDTMISELRDEVSRRIQSSVDREMRKIQSRAGKGGRSPRPPRGSNLSRESTMTEKRRRMLKVMKNQSVKTADSLSDGELTGEYSDQRSDDEYCPCDACVRKKMAARPFKVNPLAAEAPVMMEFDLLKILQLKKSPAPEPKRTDSGRESVIIEEEVRSLEVVQEEEEEDETKEDIKADIVLEETIPEVDENVEADEEEEGEQEGEDTEGDEEQEGETGGDDTSENGESEEECQCQCVTKEESQKEEGEDNIEAAGEEEEEGGGDDTGGEGEESDKETVKDAAGKSQEEDGEDGEEQDAGEVCEEGEEASDDAPKESEDSTPVEEFAGGDISASAEEEAEGSGTSKDEGEREEQLADASEEEAASSQEQGAATASRTTEGEEADIEDSDTDAKQQGETSADESANEGARAIADTAEENDGEDEVVEDIVEDFKPEEEEEEGEEESGNKREDLLHQATRTSVESQPGSMEDIDRFPPPKPLKRH